MSHLPKKITKNSRRAFVMFAFAIAICFFSFSGFVSAQFNKPLETQIDMQLSPENPGANQVVNAVIESYGTDLNSANIVWKINGQTKKSGVGVKTFSFSTGNLNKTTELGLTVTTSNGETINKTYIIKPTSVDLIWQTEGYVPPFYKGKVLFSYQNLIQFIALPHIIGANGSEIPANKLIYKWTRNGTVLGDFSGMGKNTYTLIGSVIARPLDINVEVTSPDTDGVGYASTYIEPTDPQILFYERSPLYGIQFQKALTGTIPMNGAKEISVASAPFYFGTTDPNSQNLSYKWFINGSQIDDDLSRTERVFRQKEGVTGTANVSLSMENAVKILQMAKGGFSLSF